MERPSKAALVGGLALLNNIIPSATAPTLTALPGLLPNPLPLLLHPLNNSSATLNSYLLTATALSTPSTLAPTE